MDWPCDDELVWIPESGDHAIGGPEGLIRD